MPDRGRVQCPGRVDGRHELDVLGHREDVEGAQLGRGASPRPATPADRGRRTTGRRRRRPRAGAWRAPPVRRPPRYRRPRGPGRARRGRGGRYPIAASAGVTAARSTRRFGSSRALWRASSQARASRSIGEDAPRRAHGCAPAGPRTALRRRTGRPPTRRGSRRPWRGPPGGGPRPHRSGPARRPRPRSGRCGRPPRRGRRRAVAAPSGARRRRRRRRGVGAPPFPRGVTETNASPGRVPVTTSRWATPGHRAVSAPVAATAGLAMGQASTCSSWWERCLRKPTAPSSSTARPHPGAPTEAIVVAVHRLHLDGALHAGDPRQLLGHRGSLEAPLRAELHVLEVAAAAVARPGVRAPGGDSVGRGRQDLHGVGPQVRGGGGRHQRR